MEKPLYIPKSIKWSKLHIFCNKCKRSIDNNTCRLNGKSIQKCSNGDKHVFKIILHKSGTSKGRITRNLSTRDPHEALQQGLTLERELRNNKKILIESSQEKLNKDLLNQKREGKERNIGNIQEEPGNVPLLFIQAAARFKAWLRNQGVPAHLQKMRSEGHIKDMEHSIDILVQHVATQSSIAEMRMYDFDKNVVGSVHSFLLDEKKYSPRSYNKIVGHYTMFIQWYNEEFNQSVKNVFAQVTRKHTTYDPKSITKEEFNSLIASISKENGVDESGAIKKNFYRTWLADAYRFALLTGRRREELLSLKFNQIFENANGNGYIKCEDIKVNRIQGREQEHELKYIFIPLTKNLKDLLLTLNYENLKGSNEYIIAPHIKTDRGKTLSDSLTRGFTHFFGRIKSERQLTFKCLRKTYVTALQAQMGNAKAITGHSDDDVVERHYLDKEMLALAAKDFEVFRQEDRDKELSVQRSKAQNKNIKAISK